MHMYCDTHTKDDDGSPDEGRVRVSSHLPPSGATPGGLAVKKKKKRGSKSGEAPKQPEVVVGKRPKREKVGEGPPKKTRRKSQQLPRVQQMGQPAGRGGSIQSLLTAGWWKVASKEVQGGLYDQTFFAVFTCSFSP